MDQPFYVVVGGSSGIGYDITSRLVEKGYGVLVVSRSADTLRLPLFPVALPAGQDALPVAGPVE